MCYTVIAQRFPPLLREFVFCFLPLYSVNQYPRQKTPPSQ